MRIDHIVRYTYFKSPLGDIFLARTEAGITRVQFQNGKNPLAPQDSWLRDDAAFTDANDQLHAYFQSRLERFDLPLSPRGTSFQQRVWETLQSIPRGVTWSYRQLAESIGDPNATRAVASANARNPLAIVIPCHRVIGADGKLRGYAGGLAIKAALLELEQYPIAEPVAPPASPRARIPA